MLEGCFDKSNRRGVYCMRPGCGSGFSDVGDRYEEAFRQLVMSGSFSKGFVSPDERDS